MRKSLKNPTELAIRPLRKYSVLPSTGTLETVSANYLVTEGDWVKFCIGGAYDEPVVTAYFCPVCYKEVPDE
jgi:hypothetical protein